MPLDFLSDMTPKDFGLDSSDFPSFRRDPVTFDDVQLEVIEFAAYSEKQFVGVCAPTGLGKQLIAWCLHKWTGKRTAILTATKGLQEQYGSLGKYGLVDIRGRSNYQCVEYNNLDCRGGASMGCRYTAAHSGSGCAYEKAKLQAVISPCVSTNYAYWMGVNANGPGLGTELLIMDEGHAAAGLLSDYLSTTVYESEVAKSGGDPKLLGDDVAEWKKFAIDALYKLKAEIKTTQMELVHLGQKVKKSHVDVLHQLERIAEKFTKIAEIEDDWVLEANTGTRFGRTWQFDVVWPGRYAKQYLFCGVEKVVVMSATLNKKTMNLLGLRGEEFDFKEWRRIFPVTNCPVYYYPPRTTNGEGKDVALKITRKTSEEDKRKWVEHIDGIIESRMDRRIILLTTSYAYQQFLMEHSRFSRFMMGNKNEPNSESAMDVFKQFITSKPPTILCSPSFGTGWDFEGEKAELLIISKVPLRVPGSGSKVMAARLKRDAEYGDNETMRDVVQGAGRVQRSELDRGEIVIVDGSWSWFGYKNSHLAPMGFVKDVRAVIQLPPPPKSLLK